MSRKVGLNVALNLSTQGFNKGITQAKSRLDQFGKDVKRQNEVLGKFGAAGLGRGFGMVGGGIEAITMGGMAGGIGAAAVAIGGLVFTIKSVMAAIDGLNKAATDARKTMQAVAEGKAAPGTVSGFTPSAAKAITTTTQTDILSESLASNLAPRGMEDAMKGYVASAAPNVWRAWAAETVNIMTDALLDRQRGSITARLGAATFAAVAGDLGPGAAQMANRQLEAARRGEEYQKQMAEAMRGN